ncbi:F-box protein SKIP2-like [Tripterygium wilfordii]|uniref:F-box protein SKIP2-like n=1 Tax=Tripterygium wilfordii TaxID=458696 RepID=UPI0018F86346|nr:F-box protein SKIP2-like [Tripterygium wilfordii]XP_038726095.1 F-box protein SKIP2-like [Tripterygium wilfordii]XP_038726096.1 F-box protein SKIP2-like [Tripterygium wilfordii]
MGQSSSTTAEVNIGEFSKSMSDRFLSSPIVSRDAVEKAGDWDLSSNIPDECLAYIFDFLCDGDRKRCSVVCRRWLRVEGNNRCRLSLNAQSEILSYLPSLFTRFDSVTKLALRCDRKSVSLNDDALILISLRCRNLIRLKLRGCRELTDLGVATFVQNCKGLKKLSCGSCTFGASAMNAVLQHCTGLEELSVKRLGGLFDGAESIVPGSTASPLKSICLKDLVNGQCFESLVIGSKNLKSLKISHCLGNWDKVLENIACKSNSLTEIHLERLQVSDIGFSAIAKCSSIEILHIVKAPECSNVGLVCVAEKCKKLRKLHIDGWRTNRIGDEGLIAIAKHCSNLVELVLIGVNATHLSLATIAANCQKLERLALCGSSTIGDAEIVCIATKCMKLKKLCVKGCAISNIGVKALGSGCPDLVKVKVKKCRAVTSEIADWLQERRGPVIVNFDVVQYETLDAIVGGYGMQDNVVELATMAGQVIVEDASTSNGRLALIMTKLGLFASRNLVACAFRR